MEFLSLLDMITNLILKLIGLIALLGMGISKLTKSKKDDIFFGSLLAIIGALKNIKLRNKNDK